MVKNIMNALPCIVLVTTIADCDEVYCACAINARALPVNKQYLHPYRLKIKGLINNLVAGRLS